MSQRRYLGGFGALLGFALLALAACGGAERATKKLAQPATEEEEAAFASSLPRREFEDAAKTDCTTAAADPQRLVRICAHGYYDNTDTAVEIAVLGSPNGEPQLRTTVDLAGYASSAGNVAADIAGGEVYVVWVSGNSTKQIPSAIHLRVLELKSQRVLADRVLHEQAWGIDRLAMALHPTAKLLLVAYNDISKENPVSLYLAALPLDDAPRDTAKLAPAAIHVRDRSEKTFPHFWKAGEKLYLYHGTGETWGVLSHRGKPAVAFSEIDEQGQPRSYAVIAAAEPVNDEIRIWGGEVFFERVVGTNRGDYVLEKIALADAYVP